MFAYALEMPKKRCSCLPIPLVRDSLRALQEICFPAIRRINHFLLRGFMRFFDSQRRLPLGGMIWSVISFV